MFVCVFVRVRLFRKGVGLRDGTVSSAAAVVAAIE